MLDKPLEVRDWISGAEASRVIGCAERQVPQLARLGHLSVKALPGHIGRPRFLRSDCVRLAQQIIRKATA
jgi:hypothetical protein